MTVAAILTAFALSTSLAQTPAPALSADDTADLQCLTVMTYFTGQAEEGSPEQAGLAAAMYYFYGRLEGRSPGTDWLEQLQTYVVAEKIDELEANRVRCFGQYQATAESWTRWSQRMQAQAPAE